MPRLIPVVIAAILALSAAAFAQRHGGGQGHMHGADGTGHDIVNMPGLRGVDATAEESTELAVMFRNFELIEREVENLPNGIRTRTFSTDEDVMNTLVSHVIGMIDRVDTGRDPKVRIQSPTLDILFERRASLSTQIEVTETGITVTRTSTDPEVVAALHAHAAEVSAMADRGMAAVYEMILLRGVK